MKLFRIQPEGSRVSFFQAKNEEAAREAFEKGWREVKTLDEFLEDAPSEFMLQDEAAY